MPTRSDGRPVTEHVTERRLTTPAVLDQEARLIRWAEMHARVEPAALSLEHGAPDAALNATAGHDDLVLVVGPAGAGKTTVLGKAADALACEHRPMVGLAPSGKAADVLAAETGAPAVTLAKLLHEHTRVGGPSPQWRVPPGTTVVLDEAGMASTDDLAALVTLVTRHRWRLVCVGDPEQLPAVGRGGMFSYWCDKLPAYHLDQIHRFAHNWEAEASLGLRSGDPRAVAFYAKHGRLGITHPALLADHVARQHAAATDRGESVAITTASAATAMAINREIQRWRNPRLGGPSVQLADGTRVFAGDQVATRRNDASLKTTRKVEVRNRHTWTVAAIGDDGSLTIEDPDRGNLRLPARYTSRHVELGWAVTGHGSQGIAVDRGICVIEASSSRAGIYVGMTRGQKSNLAWMLDRTGLVDARDAFAAAIARPANALTAHGARAALYRAAGLETPAQAPEPARRAAAHGSFRPLEENGHGARSAVPKRPTEGDTVQGGRSHGSSVELHPQPAHRPASVGRTPRRQPPTRPSSGRRAEDPIPQVGPPPALRPRRDRHLARPRPPRLTPMGMIYEDLPDHEGYAARRLPDGTLTATWTAATERFRGYVAACSCGWNGVHEHAREEPGREAAQREWDAIHAQPLIAEAVPAPIRELMLEARTAIARLAAQRPAASRRVLGELDTWTSHLRHQFDLGTPEPAPDSRPLPTWVDRPRRHAGPELGL